jgi:two-component system, sensor histidine kinase and response regulator
MMPAIGSEDRAQILVAEDNESNSILALRQLERLGYRAVVVRDGHEAVAAASTGRFALVLMDCHMSGMDGFAAARAIRAQEQPGSPRVPIVAVTAGATQRDREECDAAGMDDFISKPVTLQDLAGVLGRWLGFDAAGIASMPAPMGTGSGAVEEVTLRALREDLEEPAFSRFVRAYLDELPGRTIAIRRSVEVADPAGLRDAAHALKSSSAAVGAARLASLCAELEEIGRTGSTTGASERMDELETERLRVAEVLGYQTER